MNCPDLEESFLHQDWTNAMNPLFEEDSNGSSSSSSVGLSKLSLKANQNEVNDHEEEEKMCVVCGDKANGYHFHVLTCEGCKGFFRRSMTKGLQFTCPFTRICPITKDKRRQCQACRLQKCLDAGMRKDMIMTDEALTLRRALRTRKKQERLQRMKQMEGVKSLTEEQKQLIFTLTTAQDKHLECIFTKMDEYCPPEFQLIYDSFSVSSSRSPSPNSMSPPMDYLQLQNNDTLPKGMKLTDHIVHSAVFGMVPHFANVSTAMIQQVIKFAKEIPAFRDLSIDDQISLLKGSTMEICQIQFNIVFNLENNTWECGKTKYSIHHAAMTGFQHMYLEPLLKFHITFRKLKLHREEYVLMQALALFSPDRPGVIERSSIDENQEKIALTLKCYIDQHHPLPEGRFLYPKLLSILTELRSLNDENTRQILHIQDMSSNAMTPLMKEIFC
ncbi:nuclear receptor subfamily 1 group I member 3 [Bombina bombina]|uniref:nuclear receptor subfamily 1 group I member 3 n=1 Tax=Bombina bombina TaxID=8345 RepID=UPI00235A99BD|nr:nuclear receptor subfamily 1 group I member 3 [Bombina bombina]XP_053560641.1 nuclear receptor subfamily 1 group I member 3 [Bombina bombina]XP_053560645.1 nuclear receptor subfamily 1 group I member 3 [Bombina bombina]XP_053560650.1 nuclear receptor subfamily 1 group I member 3 [Bombina bombina]